MKLFSAITIWIAIFSLTPAAYADETAKDAQNEYNLGHFSRAIEIIKPLLTQNDAKAKFLMGKLYSEGNGVPENDEEAVFWYRKASSLGDVTAMAEMGYMYWAGDGVTKNNKESKRWFTRAMPQLEILAEAGDDNAQNAMGWMYHMGVTVPVNTSKAKEWYLKAAQQGNDWSICNLLALHERKIVEEVANNGIATAHFYLGRCNKGFILSLYDSWQHYNEAVNLGHEKAEDEKWITELLGTVFFSMVLLVVWNIRRKAKLIGNEGRKCPVCSRKVSFFSVFKALSMENKGVQCPQCLSYISNKQDPRNAFIMVFLGYLAAKEILNLIDEDTTRV